MHEFFHRPVNVDKIDVRSTEGIAKRPAATVAADATRRFAVFNRAAYVVSASPEPKAEMRSGNEASSAGRVHPVIICAEPPPDAAVSTLNKVSADLSAAAKALKGAEGVDLKSKIETTRAAIVSVLGNRTEVVELYRSAMFSLCQLHMNGAIGADMVPDIFKEVTNKAMETAQGSFAPGMNKPGEKLSSLSSPSTDKPADDESEEAQATEDVGAASGAAEKGNPDTSRKGDT